MAAERYLDTRLKREVALKVLPAEMAADPDWLRRFQREAETVAGLNHPHIVTLHAVEEVDGVRGAQLAAMLLDFVPEAIVLGATFAIDPARGRLLAFLIGLQNLPEGFNAFRDMVSPGRMRGMAVLRFSLLLSLLGPLAAGMGLAFFAGQSVLLGLVMVFAAGGILNLIFQDIAPAVQLENRQTPALGAVAGFLLGLIGQMLAAG